MEINRHNIRLANDEASRMLMRPSIRPVIFVLTSLHILSCTSISNRQRQSALLRLAPVDLIQTDNEANIREAAIRYFLSHQIGEHKDIELVAVMVTNESHTQMYVPTPAFFTRFTDVQIPVLPINSCRVEKPHLKRRTTFYESMPFVNPNNQERGVGCTLRSLVHSQSTANIYIEILYNWATWENWEYQLELVDGTWKVTKAILRDVS